jgi:hypothetical protein
MAQLNYMAEVKAGLLLELPTEAKELHLKPGDMVHVRLDHVVDAASQDNPGQESKYEPKVLRGMGAFKGKLGGTEALFQEKRAEFEREERHF